MNSTLPPPANSPEFEATIQAMAEDKKQKEKQLKELQAAHEKKNEPKLIEKKPLELTYRFIGACDCGIEATTLMIDNEAGYFAVAFCIPESKQLQSIKVAKLEKSVILLEKKK